MCRHTFSLLRSAAHFNYWLPFWIVYVNCYGVDRYVVSIQNETGNDKILSHCMVFGIFIYNRFLFFCFPSEFPFSVWTPSPKVDKVNAMKALIPTELRNIRYKYIEVWSIAAFTSFDTIRKTISIQLRPGRFVCFKLLNSLIRTLRKPSYKPVNRIHLQIHILS